MAKAKDKVSGLFAFDAPSQALMGKAVDGMRVYEAAKAKARKASKHVREDKDVLASLGAVCVSAAQYVLDILDQHANVVGDAFDDLAKDVRLTFNKALQEALGKGYTDSVKTTLSALHRIIVDERTRSTFGETWRADKYGAAIPDSEAFYTFNEGRKRTRKVVTAREAAKRWLRSQASKANNSRDFYGMIAELAHELANEGKAKAPKAARTRKAVTQTVKAPEGATAQ